MEKTNGKATIDYLSGELSPMDDGAEANNYDPMGTPPRQDPGPRSSNIPRSLGKLFGNKTARE
jgi:hypothetical protein